MNLAHYIFPLSPVFRLGKLSLQLSHLFLPTVTAIQLNSAFNHALFPLSLE